VEDAARPRDVIGLPGLRPARVARGLTQEELTRRTRVNRSTISHLENGVRDAHFGTIRRLAAALDVPVAQLLLGDDFPATAPVPPPPSAEPTPTPPGKRRRTSQAGR
jgi:transcriptional regulator with XRE-family HTH domain